MHIPLASTALAALAFLGCETAPPISCGEGTVLTGGECRPAPTCGPGTVLVGSQCVAEPAGSYDAGPASSSSDDAGWSLQPPGTEPPPNGCDQNGEPCADWETALSASLGEARGCSDPFEINPGLQGITARHAAHQAAGDRLTTESPDGSLFDQAQAAEVPFSYAGALVAATREGPEDVLARWLGSDTSSTVRQCWTGAGISFQTSDTGASYVTVLLIR